MKMIIMLIGRRRGGRHSPLPLCLIIILIRELLATSGIGWSGRFESVNYRKIVSCKVVLARRIDA
jgi:hypothetical protein